MQKLDLTKVPYSDVRCEVLAAHSFCVYKLWNSFYIFYTGTKSFWIFWQKT